MDSGCLWTLLKMQILIKLSKSEGKCVWKEMIENEVDNEIEARQLCGIQYTVDVTVPSIS